MNEFTLPPTIRLPPRFSYTTQGLEGVKKEGGSARREAVLQMIESLGGKLEAFYFAFGSYDGIAIADMRGHAAMAATAILANVSGAATTQTTVLLTPQELDEAVKRSGTYRAPGR